jgi:PAT family beta-lactamase induction signal transducer AmpG
VILAVYGYQGLVAGFAVTALPNWMAAQGASLAEVGAYLALTGLPWTVQPLWGPVVDRFGGSRLGARRAWVLAGLAGALACLAALPLAGGSLHGIGLVLLAHNAFAAWWTRRWTGWSSTVCRRDGSARRRR